MMVLSLAIQLLKYRLFQHVKMKAIVQDVRFKVFSIIDSLMAYHRDGKRLFYTFDDILNDRS